MTRTGKERAMTTAELLALIEEIRLSMEAMRADVRTLREALTR